jgi:putative peptide zinc metalloprotease protein
MASSTFSEHWHRVANLRLTLRPKVEIRKRWFGAERWFIVIDPLTNNFFRITPGAHAFIERLDGRTTVEEIWEPL